MNTPSDNTISGYDSNVFIDTLNGQQQIYKMYKKHITREMLDIYQKDIHHEASKHDMQVNNLPKLNFKSRKIKSILLQVLDLGNTPIYEGCDIQSPDDDNKIKLITNPPYTLGNTVSEVFHEFYSPKHTSLLNYHLIQLFHSELIAKNPLLCYPDGILGRTFIHLNNIKITDVYQDEMYCIITDLGKRIPDLVNLYKYNKTIQNGTKQKTTSP